MLLIVVIILIIVGFVVGWYYKRTLAQTLAFISALLLLLAVVFIVLALCCESFANYIESIYSRKSGMSLGLDLGISALIYILSFIYIIFWTLSTVFMSTGKAN